MKVCINCFYTGPDVKPFGVGPEKGSQRDPYQSELLLCEFCAAALEGGDLEVFHERYTTERILRREPKES